MDNELKRDSRLDFIRGVAMLTIAANHVSALLSELGMKQAQIPTLTAFGYSSAAEMFFILSGYMFGLVYLRREQVLGLCVARAIKIYKYNLFAFAAAMAVSAFSALRVTDATHALYTFQHPVIGTLQFLAMLQHPDLLGVLQTYVVLILAAPAFTWLLRRQPVLAIALSAALYTAVQFFPGLNFPGGTPADDFKWNFNPLAWQFIFVIGIVAGRARFHLKAFSWMQARRWRPFAVMSAFVIMAFVYRAELRGLLDLPMHYKESLGVIRLLHALVAVAFVGAFACLLGPLVDTIVGRSVGMIGRSTLQCYAVSIPVTYAAAALWYAFAPTYGAYFIAVVTVIVAVFATSATQSYRVAKQTLRVSAA